MTKPISWMGLLALGAGLGAGLTGCCLLPCLSKAPLEIIAEPESQLVEAGSPATFTVITRPAQVCYQWQFDGDDIPDATNAAFTIPNADDRHVGEYRVRVWRRAGKDSTRAQLAEAVRVSQPAYLSVSTRSLTLANTGTISTPVSSFQPTANCCLGNGAGYDKSTQPFIFDGPNYTSSSSAVHNPGKFPRLIISTCTALNVSGNDTGILIQGNSFTAPILACANYTTAACTLGAKLTGDVPALLPTGNTLTTGTCRAIAFFNSRTVPKTQKIAYLTWKLGL